MTARRLTPRGADRRRQLMEYASRRFAEQGYHPTSVADIVCGMGVGKGVFYWYFASKEELMLEILRESQTGLRRRQQAAIADEPDPVARIEKGIRATMAWFAENRHLMTLFAQAATERRFASALRQGQQVATSDVTRHVKEAISSGRVRDTDPEMLTQSILGVVNHMARVFVFERGESHEVVADAAVDFCLSGLLGAKAPVAASR